MRETFVCLSSSRLDRVQQTDTVRTTRDSQSDRINIMKIVFSDCFINILCNSSMTHHEQFVIKVGDLLRNPGRLDTMEIDGFVLEDIEGLSSDGVTGTITLQGVTDGSVKVVIKKATAQIQSTCDISGEEYQRQVEVKDFDARFSSDIEDGDDRVYDDIFPLDGTSETINIYDLIVQSIKLQEPLVHIKPGNEHLLDDYESDEDEDDDYEESGLSGNNNIVFH